MNGSEVFQRTPIFERDAQIIRLSRLGWDLLYAFNGNRDLSEAAKVVDASLENLRPLVQDFLTKGWISENSLSLDEYLKDAGISSVSLNIVPQLKTNTVEAPTPTAPLAPPAAAKSASPPIPPTPHVKPAPEIIRAPETRLPAQLAFPKPTATPAFKPVPPIQTTPTVPTALSSTPTVKPHLRIKANVTAGKTTSTPPSPPRQRKLKIKALIDFLSTKAETPLMAPLLIYRIFTLINPDLLEKAGLTTIEIVDNPHEITDEILQKALAEAVAKTIHEPLPENAYELI